MTAVSMTMPQLDRHECTIAGHPVPLQRQQADLLALLLVSAPDRWLDLDTIIEGIWPDPDLQPDGARNVVKVQICRLRRHGVPIDTRRICGRIPCKLNGWRIPVEARSPRAARLARKLAA